MNNDHSSLDLLMGHASGIQINADIQVELEPGRSMITCTMNAWEPLNLNWYRFSLSYITESPLELEHFSHQPSEPSLSWTFPVTADSDFPTVAVTDSAQSPGPADGTDSIMNEWKYRLSSQGLLPDSAAPSGHYQRVGRAQDGARRARPAQGPRLGVFPGPHPWPRPRP